MRMRLDRQTEEFLDLAAKAPRIEDVPVGEARRLAKQHFSLLDIPVRHVEDIRIAGSGGEIPLRVYRSAEKAAGPVIVYYHGGGWILGDLDRYENVCRTLANGTGFAVVSVDYRLAPEHPYPAAITDAYDALTWASRDTLAYGWDTSRIVVMGDSAGGTIAAVMAIKSRNEKGPRICRQVLISPATDLARMDTGSYRQCGEDYYITRSLMAYFRGLYAPDRKAWSDPYVSPLRAKDLSGLPPATIITAEMDCLRDEGEAYAKRLEEAGVPVALRRYPRMIHDFVLLLPEHETTAEAFDGIIAGLKEARERR